MQTEHKPDTLKDMEDNNSKTLLDSIFGDIWNEPMSAESIAAKEADELAWEEAEAAIVAEKGSLFWWR